MYYQQEFSNPSSVIITKRAGRYTIIPQGEGRFRHIRAFRRLDALRLESGTVSNFKTGIKNKISEISVVADSVLGFLSISEQTLDDIDFVIIKGTSSRLDVI